MRVRLPDRLRPCFRVRLRLGLSLLLDRGHPLLLLPLPARALGGYSRSTGPLTGYDRDSLLALPAEVPTNSRGDPLYDSRRHVKEYLVGCRKVAELRLLAKGTAVDVLAERVHEVVRGAGYLVDVSGVRANRSWPTGPTASSVAAAISGASWGSGATAQRQLGRDDRGDTFIL